MLGGVESLKLKGARKHPDNIALWAAKRMAEETVEVPVGAAFTMEIQTNVRALVLDKYFGILGLIHTAAGVPLDACTIMMKSNKGPSVRSRQSKTWSPRRDTHRQPS